MVETEHPSKTANAQALALWPQRADECFSPSYASPSPDAWRKDEQGGLPGGGDLVRPVRAAGQDPPAPATICEAATFASRNRPVSPRGNEAYAATFGAAQVGKESRYAPPAHRRHRDFKPKHRPSAPGRRSWVHPRSRGRRRCRPFCWTRSCCCGRCRRLLGWPPPRTSRGPSQAPPAPLVNSTLDGSRAVAAL